MKKHIVVDTSVFISRCVPSDKYYNETNKFFKTVFDKKLIVTIPITTFLEILHAYFRGTKNIKATDVIYQELIEWNYLKTLRIVNIEANSLIYFTAHHDLFDIKTADAIVALTALRFKQPLITWDKKLLAAAAPHVTAMTPKKFLQEFTF